MDKDTAQYIKIRDQLMTELQSMIEVYLTGIWDPLIKHVIIKELRHLVNRQLKEEYPDFPAKYLPQIKIRVDDPSHTIEVGIQAYLNKSEDLSFLGNVDHDEVTYDLYCRESWDPRFSHVFYARHGHSDSAFEKGSKEPAAQYMMGQITPLSIAYSFAVEEGYIA